MVATAADIPIELYDLILSFFVFNEHIGWNVWYKLNHVLINKRELGLLSLVCHRWARHCQPMMFKEVKLRNQDDVKRLLRLLTNPKCRIADYIRHVDLSQSVATYPYLPWIDLVVVQLMPKLGRFAMIKGMRVTGPLPAGQSLRSIHGVLPRRYPQFATGILGIRLKDLHLKSFGHLVRLLKELPSLLFGGCENVTWDRSPDAPLPVATSYLRRDTTILCRYSMKGCTDDAAAAWLAWLLAPRLSLRLEPEDSDALCRIASDFCKNVNITRSLNLDVESNHTRDGHQLWFGARERSNDGASAALVYVHLTSAVPGERTRRRVRAIRLSFKSKMDMSSVAGWDCWPTIDKQLATLRSLRTVLIESERHEDLVLFASDVAATNMPQLRDSTKLRYAYSAPDSDGWLWYTRDTVGFRDEGRIIKDARDIL